MHAHNAQLQHAACGEVVPENGGAEGSKMKMAGAGGRKGGEDSVGAGCGHAMEGEGGVEEFGGIAGARKGSVGVNDSKLILEVRLNAVWGLRNLSYKASFSFFSAAVWLVVSVKTAGVFFF
jgi:hypothetical protein